MFFLQKQRLFFRISVLRCIYSHPIPIGHRFLFFVSKEVSFQTDLRARTCLQANCTAELSTRSNICMVQRLHSKRKVPCLVPRVRKKFFTNKVYRASYFSCLLPSASLSFVRLQITFRLNLNLCQDKTYFSKTVTIKMKKQRDFSKIVGPYPDRASQDFGRVVAFSFTQVG